ncbi:acyl-CoA reductase-like NAD-dependent aldehyde dehydrogenase [Paraburkholderia sp. CI2]|nr:acyl-CoA reductase-like NAD-dependent aldehyde dehydrogenase [Paraburkholderia sp. CI2]
MCAPRSTTRSRIAPTLSRYERSQILERAAVLLRERIEPASDLISLESGLSKQDSRYEIGRVADVFRFASFEALRDDGQSFSCDPTPHGKRRRVFSQREPLAGVNVAITPFNHPMNQVALMRRWPRARACAAATSAAARCMRRPCSTTSIRR